MAALTVCLLGTTLLVCGIHASGASTAEALAELKDKSDHSIDYVDNDPEFLVGVDGIDKPLCFHTEGTTDQVIRLLQDPETGVVVNARIFHDDLTNKTYLGAIVIARGNFRILAKQRVVLINDVRVQWDQVKAMTIDGHRVIIGEDMVAVTFRRRHITLVVRRHFATRENSIDYDELDREHPNTITTNRESGSGTDREDNVVEKEGDGRADIIPIVGYEETESLINRFLSSKRRRGLWLHKFFGINQDQAVVRNLIVEVDTDGRKKRGSVANENGNKTSENLSSSHDNQHYRVQNQQEQQHYNVRQKQGGHEDSHLKAQPPLSQRHHYRVKSPISRQRRDMVDNEIEFEKRGDRTIFLGMYIADSRDLSNRTHGLLGQFLFKNVTLEKIRYKNGRMKARLLINGIPSRRTIALMTLRRNMALNATRACWKIRHQGHDVIDGMYSDYLVPNIRYIHLKELPPPAPL